MTAKVFLDTNILLYACSNSPEDSEKHHIARKLILKLGFVLSSQVLQEFIANALRKKELGIGEAQMDAALEMAAQVHVVPVTLELIIRATTLRRCFQLSHWDSTIIAAAQEAGCDTLYTEDLNHGQEYGGVRVVNPFVG